MHVENTVSKIQHLLIVKIILHVICLIIAFVLNDNNAYIDNIEQISSFLRGSDPRKNRTVSRNICV